uniref:GATA-type domain-containing protein n=1 Tax=Setaria italica TaxID=4555 RepID=K4AJE4_SETIT
MVVENAPHGDSVAAVADELFFSAGAGVDLETFFDHAVRVAAAPCFRVFAVLGWEMRGLTQGRFLQALEVAAAGSSGAKGEEEELEWLSNKDAFPAVETMLPAAAPRPPTKGARRRRRVVAKKAMAGRRCRHCGTEETPQWREGPEGAATLCNACGLRYRSGRLVPEYRPASSPTFSPEMHSNRHNRVVEMRRQRQVAAVASPGAAFGEKALGAVSSEALPKGERPAKRLRFRQQSPANPALRSPFEEAEPKNLAPAAPPRLFPTLTLEEGPQAVEATAGRSGGCDGDGGGAQ